MISRLALAFALLMSGVAFHPSLAIATCPAVAQDSLSVSGQSLPLIRVGNAQIVLYPVATLGVTPAGRNTVNVRAQPSAQSALVGSIAVDGSVTADGRNSDGSWLHVQLAEGGMGWVSASVIKVDNDVSTLVVRSADDAAFPSSVGFDLNASPDPNCPNAPNGVLLQTPEGADLILNVDGVMLDLNKAAVFIMDDPQGLGIVVLKGTVLLQSASEVTPIEAGKETHLARSADGRATGHPDTPFASAPSFIAQLPLAQLGSAPESATPSTDDQTPAPETALLADTYGFAIDSNIPSACVSGEISPDEAAQEGARLVPSISSWTTPLRYLQPNESIDVPVADGATQTVSAITNEQVMTLTIEDFGRQTVVALTQVAPYRYEFFQTVDGNSVGYRMDTESLPTLKLSLIFNYQVSFTIGGENVAGSSQSCQDFEVYLTGTPQS